jgi:hypothetical protein
MDSSVVRQQVLALSKKTGLKSPVTLFLSSGGSVTGAVCGVTLDTAGGMYATVADPDGERLIEVATIIGIQ